MLMPHDSEVSRRLLNSFYERATWQLKFAWLPKRCVFSKKIIWLENAYCGVGIWTGPGDDVIETHWSKDVEFIVWQLKR